jgi:hypothetical protein
MPEVEAVIPGVTGDFFERGNVTDLARVIGAWTNSRERRASAQGDAIAIIESTYNPQHQVQLIDATIDSIAGGVAAQPRDDGGRQQSNILAGSK